MARNLAVALVVDIAELAVALDIGIAALVVVGRFDGGFDFGLAADNLPVLVAVVAAPYERNLILHRLTPVLSFARFDRQMF